MVEKEETGELEEGLGGQRVIESPRPVPAGKTGGDKGARSGNGRQWSDASAPEVTAACGGTERGDEPECAGVGMLESRQRKYVARGDLGGGVRAGHTHTHTEREREALLEDGHDFEDDEDDVGIVRRLLLRRR